jgi:hypothetical protein
LVQLSDALSGKTLLNVSQSTNAPSLVLNLTSVSLAPLSAYRWRVCVNTTLFPASTSACSAWSPVVTGWKGGSAAAAPAPMWLPNADGFVLFRREASLLTGHGPVVLALAAVTANPQTTYHAQQNAKLLASYKLFVGGTFAGVGPGRISTCGPVCPIQGGDTECFCEPHHLYDVFNVTSLVSSPGNLTVALQTYMSRLYTDEGDLPPKVTIQLDIVFADGARQTLSSGSQFRAWNATSYFNPSCCASAYSFDPYQPHENFDARAEPLGWQEDGFDDSSWLSASAQPPYPVPLRPRPSRHLLVTHDIEPSEVLPFEGAGTTWIRGSAAQPVQTQALETQPMQAQALETQPVQAQALETAASTAGAPHMLFAANSDAPMDLFVDFGLERMGGLDVVVNASQAGVQLDVTLSEDLLPGSDWPRPLKVPMNTGNDYHDVWTLREGAQRFTQHEYSEFRFARIRVLSTGPQACAVSELGDYTTPVLLGCPSHQTVTSVAFASFGTPSGSCSSGLGVNASCSAAESAHAVASACVGRNNCSVVPSTATFGGDPCEGTMKQLAARVQCSGPTPPAPSQPPIRSISVRAWSVRYDADYSGTEMTVTAPNETLAGIVARIHDFSRYTQQATTIDMFTDSNTRQRDVMCGENANLNSRMGWASSLEFMVQRQSVEYTIQQRGWGGPGAAEWPMIMVLTVWQDYMRTGQLDLAVKHYQTLKNWTGAVLVNRSSGLWSCPPCGGLSEKHDCTPTVTLFNCNGPEIDWPSSMRDGFVFVPENTVVNAFSHRALRAFASLATALGRDADAAEAEALAATMRASATQRLLRGNAYVDGVGTDHQAWHSTVFSLLHGLADDLPAQNRSALVDTVAQGIEAVNGVVGGVYLGPWALTVLFDDVTDHGHRAIGLIAATGSHSWLHQLAQNATTGMEAWDPEDKPNLTYSHPWGASLVFVMAERLLGVMATAPGFETFDVRPQLGPLSGAASTVPTIRGPIAVNATQDAPAAGQRAPSGATVQLTVPGASVATVYLPVLPGALVTVDGGAPAEPELEAPHQAYAVIRVGPGYHTLRAGSHAAQV